MNLQDIIRETEGFDDREFVGPVREHVVAKAEQALGVCFPPEYRQFLRTLGAGSVSSESFVGLGGPTHLDIVWLTHKLRQKPAPSALPIELLPLRSDGFGNYDCIDSSRPTANGEYAIVEWLHDGGGQVGRTLAASYFEWLRSIFQMIREIEQ